MPFGDIAPAGYKSLQLKPEAEWASVDWTPLSSTCIVHCEQCRGPYALWTAPLMESYRGELLCSDACRVLAEWYAPERR